MIDMIFISLINKQALVKTKQKTQLSPLF